MSAPRGGSWRRDLIGSVAVKLGFFVPSALASFIALRSVSTEFSLSGLAIFSLVGSLPTLLPFSDLGMGGSLTQAVAQLPAVRDHIVHAYRATLIRLLAVASAIALAAVVFQVFGVWPALLGTDSPEASTAATTVLILFAASLPLSLGYRVLLGLQRNSTVVLLQSASGVAGSVFVISAALFRAPLALVVALPTFSGLLFAAIGTWFAIRSLPERRPENSRPVWKFSYVAALSFLIISIAAPVTFQTDRVLLANLSTTDQLADYAAAFQLYAPANALVIAAGQVLWPRFAALRQHGSRALARALGAASAAFLLAGGLLGVGLIVVGPAVANWTTAGLADPSPSLLVAFGGLITLNAALYPAGMLMVGGSAVRIQAFCAVTTAVAKVILAVTVFSSSGAAGMVVSTVTALVAFTAIPVTIYVVLALRRSDGLSPVGDEQ